MTLGAAIGYLMGRVRTADRLGDPWLILLLNLPALVVIVLQQGSELGTIKLLLFCTLFNQLRNTMCGDDMPV
jgi:ABC-type nitrate/sulfonate/bicarbonate transport system permease component